MNRNIFDQMYSANYNDDDDFGSGLEVIIENLQRSNQDLREFNQRHKEEDDGRERFPF